MDHSVVIPLYNKQNYIEKALLSLFNQTKKPYELIVVDDCSSDDSVKLVQQIYQEYSGCGIILKLISAEKNAGPGAARNLGIAESTGELISFLDADDEYCESYIESVFTTYERTSFDLLIVKVKFSTTNKMRPNLNKFKTNTDCNGNDLYHIKEPFNLLTKESLVVSGGNVICNKRILDSIWYDENSRNFEDWDFWYRVLKSDNVVANDRIYFMDTVLCIQDDRVEDSLSRKAYLSPCKIEMPVLVERLNCSKNSDEILYRKLILSMWVFNALDRLKDYKSKAGFVSLHRRILLQNFTFNRYYIGSLLYLIMPISLVKLISSKFKQLFY